MSVVEIKDDNQVRDPDEENIGKYIYAQLHFTEINRLLAGTLTYKFNFLTPNDYYTYFEFLREGKLLLFNSQLDLRLDELSKTQ